MHFTIVSIANLDLGFGITFLFLATKSLLAIGAVVGSLVLPFLLFLLLAVAVGVVPAWRYRDMLVLRARYCPQT